MCIMLLGIACTEDENMSRQLIENNLKLGDKYLGGRVFYLFKEGDIEYIEGENHGLIVGNITTDAYPWGCSIVGQVFSNELGGGEYNTSLVLENCGMDKLNIFNVYCLDKKWYIPNMAEFSFLRKQIAYTDIDINSQEFFWTSSRYSDYTAYTIRLIDGKSESKGLDTYIPHKRRAILITKF